MKINPNIIRGYDIRGLVNKDLNEEILENFGKAYGSYMIRHGEYKAIIGHDSRGDSVAYKDAFIRGLISTGMDVIDMGLIMVGTKYWAQYHFNTKSAIMITASHNPKEFNGMKLAKNYSESMILEDLKSLIRQIETEDFVVAKTAGSIKKIDITQEYFNDILQRVKIEKKFKVVVDPSCSTPGAIVPNLLRQAGCEVIESNCNLDPSFPLGVADPTETIVAERLRDKVLETGADLGFSYDSDGDRIGIVDEKGTIIWNDVLVALLALDVLNSHPHSKIMFNTLCSKVVSDTIEKYGGEAFMWRTGHGFLKKKNQEIGAPFIGELSGHFFFSADFYNHDDGCYVTLRLLEYLSRTNQSLNQAISQLPHYISSPEIKLYCDDSKKIALIEKISPILKNDFKDAEVIDDERAGDGVRLEMNDSMFIIRYSQNGPYITIKFEAKTEEKYIQLKKYISNLLHTFIEIEWDNEIRVNVESLE
ncbi:MAG: Phosphomannomutase [Candidatus Falkowbacteria bacterium GW2011_GWC2_38_22]|uniref:Phosphomannomutase n=1 Tax=Candidatus Falkowbacteria bacterium GW2011_GWE1_38_31 TaxID=1618638 RepID=A0A0G0K459_9BACT|nr:MAG: Phosphomannomutase [Candidatus Falkowbacteria bacterium GW2011_GWF2_38_1205]KKQ61020.1 MAG: Phosphomannomutase [Candidatus Falkowbacteria bacterium GW2011_GWC2_38_22]KKQ63451.1 MAG: Phosphomannomutase [Candidatus Falkowbacteria bacterium GW2011_GWF1_38_22]KKQ65478.1 MAG: Phosphomannomutase [Candidatus Falkowbacteria bacterium GW2011_GWE2_38_254]KKQ70215.1 MAG: Phosphomannomutase [Candidatus Falkowbacteria bacterium GW2011_GWE1_38_31]KKQ72609.1 MAG: Phosphomannomutase [Candidatus Falkow